VSGQCSDSALGAEYNTIALDATYSIGDHLSGVGVYSREILLGLAAAHPETDFQFCYRAHRFARSFRERLPANCRRFLLQEPLVPRRAELFHGLNQRLPTIRPRRTVTTFHDLFVLTGDYSTPEFRQRFADQARRAAAESDRIITVSEFTATQVEQLLGVERSRLRVVHHGVRIPPGGTAKLREKIILHVGAIQARKNIARLVRAFETVPQDWRLVLAGSAGFGADAILHDIEASPARDRIPVLGYVTAEALADWYARSTILAFPSLDEGFGIPIIEAMAAGLPVLTSNRSAMAEVAGDAAVLVNPESAEELAEALQGMIADEQLRERLKQKGLARACKYTWPRAVENTWKVYGELI
jgi:glycosyltransferase involved in cell wall biosynthesis